MIVTKLLSEANPTCACSRPRIPLHCRTCGSSTIYGIVRANVKLQDGVIAKGFRCRRCSAEFNEMTPCEALPPRKTKLQEYVEATHSRIREDPAESAAAIDFMRQLAKIAKPEDKARIEEELKKRGLEP